MLSNRWTKQFSSTNRILNFILNELEKLDENDNKHDEMEDMNHRIPLQIQSSEIDTNHSSNDDTEINLSQSHDEKQQSKPVLIDEEGRYINGDFETEAGDMDKDNDDIEDVEVNADHETRKTNIGSPRKLNTNSSRVLKKMRSQSKIDLNLVYRADKDILTIDGKEKYIAYKLMNERQKELANIFAKLYDLGHVLTLLENVCSDIVDFEFGYRFNKRKKERSNYGGHNQKDNMENDNDLEINSNTIDIEYFEHIFKMTAWTEIRLKLHSRRIDWNIENIFWTKGLQKFLNKCCYCFCNKHDCCSPNDDEFECCWAKIEYFFMGSIRFGYLPLIFRYMYMTLIILIINYWYRDQDGFHNDDYLYAYYLFVGLSFLELLTINYCHHFVTMFKLKTLLKWGYKIVPKSILTGLILDDLLWFNSPPLIVLNDINGLCHTIGVLRHLLMLHSFKLSVMIITGLLQIAAKPNTSYNVILSIILTFVIVVYCFSVQYLTNKHYLKPNGIFRAKRSYKVIYLGLLSLTLLVLVSALQNEIQNWYWLVLILYPFLLFLTTTLAVGSSCLWVMVSLSCHYNFMSDEYIENNKCIFWMVSLVMGFFLIELETRRISRSLRWSDMKQNESWVRGGCITNCWLHFCCAGCSSD